MPMKNRDLILVNLEEAIEQLQETVAELSRSNEYEEVELKIDLEHAYHHMNYAWNIRNVEDSELSSPSSDNFKKWSKFPIGEIDEYE